MKGINKKSLCISGHAVERLVEALPTNVRVACSIPHYVIATFHSHNTSGCTMALGSTQHLTEMSTRNIYSGVKSAGA